MRATEILREEHALLERVLVALDIAAVGAAHQKDVRPGFFIDVYEFVLEFTEGFHFKKEEEILFKHLVSKGLPVDGGEIGSLLADHQQSHRYVRAMLEAARQWDAENDLAKSEVIWATSSYTGLLHAHIKRENNVLFNLVGQEFTREEQKHLAEEFDKFNHTDIGEHLFEKYQKMASVMEKEADEWK